MESERQTFRKRVDRDGRDTFSIRKGPDGELVFVLKGYVICLLSTLVVPTHGCGHRDRGDKQPLWASAAWPVSPSFGEDVC